MAGQQLWGEGQRDDGDAEQACSVEERPQGGRFPFSGLYRVEIGGRAVEFYKGKVFQIQYLVELRQG